MYTILALLEHISWCLWLFIVLAGVALRDIIQRKHTISHNYPIIGHFRYFLENIGPELRQYLVANNREELIEISHATGYEHPCQVTMKDIEVIVDDHNLTKELSGTYQYEKTIVPYTSLQHLKDCEYLGGQNKSNK